MQKKQTDNAAMQHAELREQGTLPSMPIYRSFSYLQSTIIPITVKPTILLREALFITTASHLKSCQKYQRSTYGRYKEIK